MSEYDDVLAAVYGSADDALRARYGPLPKRRARRATPAAVAEPREGSSRAGYRVTSHGRIKCACGVYVYTEQFGNRPAAFPPECWRCRSPLDPRGGNALESAVVQATREQGN